MSPKSIIRPCCFIVVVLAVFADAVSLVRPHRESAKDSDSAGERGERLVVVWGTNSFPLLVPFLFKCGFISLLKGTGGSI